MLTTLFPGPHPALIIWIERGIFPVFVVMYVASKLFGSPEPVAPIKADEVRRRRDSLNLPKLDGYTIVDLEKDASDSWFHARAAVVLLARNPDAGLITDEAKTLFREARMRTEGLRVPALAFGGGVECGARCDNVIGRKITRTTKEPWATASSATNGPLVTDDRYRHFQPKNVNRDCVVWHLQGGGYMYAAQYVEGCTVDRRPVPLTYASPNPQNTEIVIQAVRRPERNLNREKNLNREFCRVLCGIGLLLSGLIAFVYLCRKHQVFSLKEEYKPTAEEVAAHEKWFAEQAARYEAALREFLFLFILLVLFCVACVAVFVWVAPVARRVARRRERNRLAAAAVAAEAAAAELLADEPASRDDARAGLRRRAPRGRRRERARGAPPSAKKPAPAVAVPESKPEPPVAPESKTEEPPAAPEAKREEEETPAATAPPPGKKVLVDDDILDDAAAHARTLETSLTAHQAEVQRLKKVLKEQQREIPDAYLCPITMDPMEDPCIAADGHSYERRAIKDWFARGKRTSPKTGAQLDDTRLFPNHALKSAIQDFLEEVRRFDAATAGAQD